MDLRTFLAETEPPPSVSRPAVRLRPQTDELTALDFLTTTPPPPRAHPVPAVSLGRQVDDDDEAQSQRDPELESEREVEHDAKTTGPYWRLAAPAQPRARTRRWSLERYGDAVPTALARRSKARPSVGASSGKRPANRLEELYAARELRELRQRAHTQHAMLVPLLHALNSVRERRAGIADRLHTARLMARAKSVPTTCADVQDAMARLTRAKRALVHLAAELEGSEATLVTSPWQRADDEHTWELEAERSAAYVVVRGVRAQLAVLKEPGTARNQVEEARQALQERVAEINARAEGDALAQYRLRRAHGLLGTLSEAGGTQVSLALLDEDETASALDSSESV